MDPKALDTAVNARTRARVLQYGTRAVMAVDGKEARGAENGGDSRVFPWPPLATAPGRHGTGIHREKTSEVPHSSALMDRLGDLNGAVSTAHALHAQSGHAHDLHARGAHYVFTVKTSQSRRRQRISTQTWSTRKPAYVQREKAHGRTTVWSATAPPAQE